MNTKLSRIVHITPHLGGGVGKALCALVEASDTNFFQHIFLLIERPEKTQFLDKLIALGGELIIAPNTEQVEELISSADIVQIEWWNHPAIFKFICEQRMPPMRLLVWCHISGLHTPVIPPMLIEVADSFLLTSPCSFLASSIASLHDKKKEKISVVSSGTGLSTLIHRSNSLDPKLNAGYIGSFNFSKLHPNFVQYLAAVDIPDFQIRVWGDEINRELLIKQCIKSGKPYLLNFSGYTMDVANALSTLNVFVYLLNPAHYGTAENVLIEAMSAGLVPVVLNNPAEMCIIEDHKTGLIVSSPSTFSAAIEWLVNYPEERQKISNNAANLVNKKYTSSKIGRAMELNYRKVINKKKHTINFRSLFGSDPAEWYLVCLDKIDIRKKINNSDFSHFSLLDKTKGSIQHFLSYFPDNPRLQKLANLLLDTNEI